MSNAPKDFEDSKPLRIRRGRVDSVDLYEIKDGELDTLERGSPGSLQLNVAICVLSLAFSAFCSLVTATFSYDIVRTAFVVVTVVGVLMGAYLVLMYRRDRKSVKALCKEIRERIPPDFPPPSPRSGNRKDSEQPRG